MRFGLVAAAALVLASCSDSPTDTRQKPRGALTLPAGTHAALIEFRSDARIASVSVGFGDLEIYAAPEGTSPFRAFLAGDGELREALPVRVEFMDGETPSLVTGVLLETADAEGSVSAQNKEFKVR